MIFALTVLAFLLRTFLILRDSVPFAYDMGRDLLWAKDISFYLKPTLIGPAGSIWGVYFGPLWFYFLSAPLRLSGGNPLSAVFATAGFVVATGLLSFLLFQKYVGKLFALLLLTVFLFSSEMINISTFAFHANMLPFLTLLTVFFFFLADKRPIYLVFSFFTTSLMFHADPATGAVFSASLVLVAFCVNLHRLRKIKKEIILSTVAFGLPFIPQILFELRNNFIQTRALLSYFTGNNPSLSGQLPILDRFQNRAVIFYDFFKSSFLPTSDIVVVIYCFLIIFGIYLFLKRYTNYHSLLIFKINSYLLIVNILLFTIIFTPEVKNWYLLGLIVPSGFLVTFGILGYKRYKLILFTLIIFFVIINSLEFISLKRHQKLNSDPSLLENQKKALDLMYKDAKESYSVYIFTPPIYDYNYQYLIWWQGVVKKRGLPQEFAYLPNQPEYVRNKTIYAKDGSTPTIYLIIENAPANEFYTLDMWLENFKQYHQIWENNINEAILVKKFIK